MSRRDARETAFHLLFQLSIQTAKRRQQEDFFWELVTSDRHAICEQEGFALSNEDLAFAKTLVDGVYPMAAQLDKRYAPYLKGWEVKRLPNIDRQILRLAVYELQEMEDIPTAVAVNEAVLLARKYSTETSRIYINAVLGRMARDESTDEEDTPLFSTTDTIDTSWVSVSEALTLDEVFSSPASVETALSHPASLSGIQYGLAMGEVQRVLPPSPYDFYRPGMSV